MERIFVKIRRQEKPDSEPYWEDFLVPYRHKMTVIHVLQEIQKNPMNLKDEAVNPVVWESSCHQETCGSCTMQINGQVKQACSSFIDEIGASLSLKPLSKFPIVRDLVVNRKIYFDHLKEVTAWNPFDGTHEINSRGHSTPSKSAEESTQCIHCGSCLEVCPQFNDRSHFLGASALNQAKNLDRLMQEGGVEDCGNAQKCEKACPKGIPLIESIGKVKRQVTWHAVEKVFGV